MTKTAQDVYNEIIAYVRQEGGTYNTWYAGITTDINKRLHGDHNVPKEGGSSWIWRRTTSAAAARNVEKALLEQGMKGDTGGGDETSDCVYCYKITNTTVE